MQELGATDFCRILRTLDGKGMKVSEESFRAAFRILFPGAQPLKKDEQQVVEQEKQPKSLPERQWPECYYERMLWMTQYFWYRGFLKPKQRYRKHGLLLNRQKVNWRYVAECYRREHPDDQAAQKTLEYTYGKIAPLLNARELFAFFRYVFVSHCSSALFRYFSHGLTLDQMDQFEKFVDGLVKDWEPRLPPAGDELIAFALAHWEEITSYRRSLLDCDEFGEEARQALSRLCDHIRAHHAIPDGPLTYRSTRFSSLHYSCRTYNALYDSPAPLYFVEEVQATFPLVL